MRYLITLTVAAAVFCAASVATACKCAPPPAPKKALAASSAVFLGKVTSIDRKGDARVKVTFEVQTNFKNTKVKKVTVSTGRGGGDCGYRFKEGEAYLVYCYGKPKALSTGICSRTRRAADAKEDLAALSDGVAVRVPR
jgi:hypothetical protein